LNKSEKKSIRLKMKPPMFSDRFTFGSFYLGWHKHGKHLSVEQLFGRLLKKV